MRIPSKYCRVSKFVDNVMIVMDKDGYHYFINKSKRIDFKVGDPIYIEFLKSGEAVIASINKPVFCVPYQS